MEPGRQVSGELEAERSDARGRRSWAVPIAPWLIAVWGGVAASALFGFGLAIGVAGGMAIALAISLVWVVVVLAVGDADAGDRVRDALERSGCEGVSSPFGDDGVRRP